MSTISLIKVILLLAFMVGCCLTGLVKEDQSKYQSYSLCQSSDAVIKINTYMVKKLLLLTCITERKRTFDQHFCPISKMVRAVSDHTFTPHQRWWRASLIFVKIRDAGAKYFWLRLKSCSLQLQVIRKWVIDGFSALKAQIISSSWSSEGVRKIFGLCRLRKGEPSCEFKRTGAVAQLRCERILLFSMCG